MKRMQTALTVLGVGCALASGITTADVYTWVDAKGIVTVSNLRPPEGSRVTSITQEASDSTARVEAAREAARQAEVQALAARVRQLENEVQAARQPVVMAAPAPVVYAPPQPIIVAMVAPEQAAPAAPACDPSWYGCWGGWGARFYPSGFFVVPGNGRPVHGRPPFRFDPNIPHRPFPVPRPGVSPRPSLGMAR